MTSDAAPQRVDPRIIRTRERVHDAVLAELAAVGVAGFTVESVAARAGVGKATIYRHWDGRLDLIADAMEARNRQPDPRPEGTTAREQVEALLRHLARAMADPRLSAVVPALVEASERDAEVARFFHQYNRRRRATLVQVLVDGRARGELPAVADAEVTAQALIGPIVYRRLMTAEPYDPDRVGEIVDAVLGTGTGTGTGHM